MRGAARAEDAQGTPAQSHTSPSKPVFEDDNPRSGLRALTKCLVGSALSADPAPQARGTLCHLLVLLQPRRVCNHVTALQPVDCLGAN